MRHHANTRKLGRVKKQRTALLRSLAASLINEERIHTTEAKAKALRPFIEKLVTRARKGDVHARRLLNARLGGRKKETAKLVTEIAPRYNNRPGGYTRITKLPPRKSDGAKMAIIEFVEEE